MFGSESRPVFAGYEHAPAEGDKGAPDATRVATGWNLRLSNFRAPCAQGTITTENALSAGKRRRGSRLWPPAGRVREGLRTLAVMEMANSAVGPNFSRVANANRLLKIAADHRRVASLSRAVFAGDAGGLSRNGQTLAQVCEPAPWIMARRLEYGEYATGPLRGGRPDVFGPSSG